MLFGYSTHTHTNTRVFQLLKKGVLETFLLQDAYKKKTLILLLGHTTTNLGSYFSLRVTNQVMTVIC